MTFSGSGGFDRFLSLNRSIQTELSRLRGSGGRISQAAIRRELRNQGFRFRDSIANELIRININPNAGVDFNKIGRQFTKAFNEAVIQGLNQVLPEAIEEAIRNSSFRLVGEVNIEYQHRAEFGFVDEPFDFTVQGSQLINNDVNALVQRHFAGNIRKIVSQRIISEEGSSYFQDIMSSLEVKEPVIEKISVSND